MPPAQTLPSQRPQPQTWQSLLWAGKNRPPLSGSLSPARLHAFNLRKALMAEKTIGSISQFMWDTAVLLIGQLASEMRVSMCGQSIGGSNGNADELTNWDGTKKKGLGW